MGKCSFSPLILGSRPITTLEGMHVKGIKFRADENPWLIARESSAADTMASPANALLRYFWPSLITSFSIGSGKLPVIGRKGSSIFLSELS